MWVDVMSIVTNLPRTDFLKPLNNALDDHLFGISGSGSPEPLAPSRKGDILGDPSYW